MAVNWNLLQPADIAGSFQQGMEQGRQRQAQNALAAYARNPDAGGLDALADHAPEFVLREKQRQATQKAESMKQVGEVLGRVAMYADTPEKWDAGMRYLSQFDPTFEQHAGKFSPANRMAMIAFSDNVKAYQEQNADFTLVPGARRFNAGGQLIAEAPFAPRPVTVGEGQTVVEYAPGAGDAGSIFQNMIKAESNGQQFAPNGQPLTSGAGAIGIAQVMPGTAPEAARLAGLPFDENRYRTDPQYNAALGKAYFEKQLQTFGDPALAVAAYNAGPGRVQEAVRKGGDNWMNHVPQETRDYVGKVLGPAGSRVIAQGPPKQPKPQWRTLTPEEAQAQGLPAGTYQQSPDGEIKPIGGIGDNAPQSKEAYSQSAMDAFDRAIASADRLKKHKGMGAAVGSGFDPRSWGSFNPLTGETLAGTEAANFGAELAAMKAQVFLPMVQSMKGMGALSNAEGEKLTAAIGALDTKMSEGAFVASLDRITKDLKFYRDRATGSAPAPQRAAGGPVRIKDDAGYAKLKSGTVFIGPDGVTRRKP